MEKVAEEKKEVTREVLQPWMQGEVLAFASLHSLMEEGYRPIDILDFCEKEKISISQGKNAVEASLLIQLHKLLVKQDAIEHKKRQEAGIRKALQKKHEGTGEYGRPCVELPEDFEQQVIAKLENRESLAQYYETLQIKRSTFYKWTRHYKQKWKEEKLKDI